MRCVRPHRTHAYLNVNRRPSAHASHTNPVALGCRHTSHTREHDASANDPSCRATMAARHRGHRAATSRMRTRAQRWDTHGMQKCTVESRARAPQQGKSHARRVSSKSSRHIAHDGAFGGASSCAMTRVMSLSPMSCACDCDDGIPRRVDRTRAHASGRARERTWCGS